MNLFFDLGGGGTPELCLRKSDPWVTKPLKTRNTHHFEHNFGHGKHHLSVVFAMLMMLAFLVDQVQQICCPLFRATWEKFGTKRSLWENLRSHFQHFNFESMRHIYEVMLHDLAKNVPAPKLDSS